MKFKIGDKVLAFAYDSIGYYRGDDLGNAVGVEILDTKVVDGVIFYMTVDRDKNWEVYKEMELFESQEEIDNIK